MEGQDKNLSGTNKWVNSASSAIHTLSGAAASLLVFVSVPCKHTTGKIKQQEVYDRTALFGVRFDVSSHLLYGCFYPCFCFLRLCKLFFVFLPARDVHRQVDVWIVACLVMLRICLAVIMTDNNRNYHFHYGVTRLGVLRWWRWMRNTVLLNL